MSGLQSQMRARDREMVPLMLVRAMFGLMAASLILVFAARLTDRPLVGVPVRAPVVAEATVFLEGDRNGEVTVRDVAGNVVARSNEDKNGFIGVLWRAMARERMLQGLPDDAPVRAVRRGDGTIAVVDTASDWSVELVGYGPDNIAAFAKLIP
jgi:putative photosynthetic complex assembly protein